MAMLAEPKRKKQYVLNPRGKALYNDEDRFGSKMLQKMGWTKGKGLGAKESGNVDFVRINFKSDAAGLGFQDRDDQWTEHEKGFNGLLNTLRIENGCYDDEDLKNTMSEDKLEAVGFEFKQSDNKLNKLTEAISGQSLEEKSKQSKARVHYKKYTKGKDLTQYSEKDLANIFGKKIGNNKETEKNVSNDEDSNSQPSFTITDYFKNKTKDENTHEPSSIVNEESVMLKTSTTSIDDYFKKKIQEKNEKCKQKKEEHQQVNGSEPIECATTFCNETKGKNRKRKINANTEECDLNNAMHLKVAEEETTKTRIKKSKTEKQALNIAESKTQTEESNVQKHSKTPQDIAIKTKNKKKKRDVQENLEDSEKNLKATKKNKKRASVDEALKSESAVCSEETSNESNITEKTKIKKKKRDVQDNIEFFSSCQTSLNNEDETNITTKKKKKCFPDDEGTKLNHSDCDNKQIKHEKNVSINEKKKNTSDKCYEIENETLSNNKNETKTESENHKQVKNEVAFLTKPMKQLNTSKQTINTWEEFQTYYNTYQISSLTAERFRHFKDEDFKNSNILEIDGYSLDKNMKLKIVERKQDEYNILKLWEKLIDKYDTLSETKPEQTPFESGKSLSNNIKKKERNKRKYKIKKKSAFKHGI